MSIACMCIVRFTSGEVQVPMINRNDKQQAAVAQVHDVYLLLLAHRICAKGWGGVDREQWSAFVVSKFESALRLSTEEERKRGPRPRAPIIRKVCHSHTRRLHRQQ